MSVVRKAFIFMMGAVIVACGGGFTATSETYSTEQGQRVSVTLKSSGATGAVTYTTESLPLKGELTGTPPNLEYLPNPGFYGSDSFNFKAETIIDNKQTEATGKITINVTQVVGGDDQVTTSIQNIKVFENVAVMTVNDSFTSSCNADNQVAVELTDANSVFMAGLNSLIISQRVTIFMDGCTDVSGSSMASAKEILVLANED